MVQGVFVGEKGKVRIWTAEYNAPQVEIVNAPAFINANGKAPVPVVFRVKNFKTVKVKNIEVTFEIGEENPVSHTVPGQLAGGNGNGDQANGKHNVYTVLIPRSKFQGNDGAIRHIRYRLSCAVAQTEMVNGTVTTATDFVHVQSPWYEGDKKKGA